jgi:hypothetical protein
MNPYRREAKCSLNQIELIEMERDENRIESRMEQNNEMSDDGEQDGVNFTEKQRKVESRIGSGR